MTINASVCTPDVANSDTPFSASSQRMTPHTIEIHNSSIPTDIRERSPIKHSIRATSQYSTTSLHKTIQDRQSASSAPRKSHPIAAFHLDRHVDLWLKDVYSVPSSNTS